MHFAKGRKQTKSQGTKASCRGHLCRDGAGIRQALRQGPLFCPKNEGPRAHVTKHRACLAAQLLFPPQSDDHHRVRRGLPVPPASPCLWPSGTTPFPQVHISFCCHVIKWLCGKSADLMEIVMETWTVALKKAKCFNISSEGRLKKKQTKKTEGNDSDTFQSLLVLIHTTVFWSSQDLMITSIRLLLLLSVTISIRFPYS